MSIYFSNEYFLISSHIMTKLVVIWLLIFWASFTYY